MLRRSGQSGSSISADAGTAMGGRMCARPSVIVVLLRTSCRWRSGATPVTTVSPSLPNRMLSLLICVAKDAVIMLSLPHVICWEHGVEGGQAVTTKDRARDGARSLSVPCTCVFWLGKEGVGGSRVFIYDYIYITFCIALAIEAPERSNQPVKHLSFSVKFRTSTTNNECKD